MTRQVENIGGQRLMKSGKTFMFRFGVFIIVMVFLIGGCAVWWNTSLSSVSQTDKEPAVFAIRKGDGVKTIASKLSQQGLIRSSTAFFIFVKIQGIERDLQAGDYRLTKSMSTSDIARELTHGILDVWVTTLEGWRVEEIATKLAKDLDIPESEFLKVAREGYMFPDTYLIPRDASASGIADIFEGNFNKKITLQMRTDSKKTGLTIDELVVMASIVEKEGKTQDDRPVIAGILYNRLKEDMPLQVDATLQYILGYDSKEKTWWRKGIADSDKKISSPYNTYKYIGLPPGPIANPGIGALMAVIYPKESQYMYYIHDEKGLPHYAKTLEEHEQNVATYLHY
jgi:UPF0755 protein